MMTSVRRPKVLVFTVLIVAGLFTVISIVASQRWLGQLSGFGSAKGDENNVVVASLDNPTILATSSGTKKEFPKHSLSSNPPWLRQYIQWHNSMREKFPDREIIDHPDSPPKLIMICTGGCGGTHDRFGSLESALTMANLTGRVLLWSWHYPYPLEEFLQPTLLNWTVPYHDRLTKENITKEPSPNGGYRQKLKRKHSLYDWMANVSKNKDAKILTAGGLGNPFHHLLAGTNITIQPDPLLYSKMWHSMFRPSAGVQKELDKTLSELKLQPGEYTATHVRTRHPGRFAGGKGPQGKNGSVADVSGLPWEGELMEMAVKAGVHAVNCSRLLLSSPDEPIYFYSDSEDLVRHIVTSGSSTNSTARSVVDNNTTIMQHLNQLTSSVTQAVRVVSRDTHDRPAVHIDRAPTFPVELFYSSFIDLYMGTMARCVSFGVGNYAYLATHISGTSCLQRHESMVSKGLSKTYNQQGGHVPMCPLP
jgi:hypothetical protein